MNRKIEDVVKELLKEETQKAAFHFIDFLRDNEVPIEESENYWEVKYNGQILCYIFINGLDDLPGPWTIWSDQVPGTWAAWPCETHSGEYVDFPIDEHIRETAWKNVNYCGSCGGKCSPGRNKIILGKEFEKVCNSAMSFTNPNMEALECAKKMVEIRMKDILKII